MKMKGTMTPDRRGGFNIELSDSKNGVTGVLVSLGFAIATGGASYFGSWAMQKMLEKKEKAKNKKA